MHRPHWNSKLGFMLAAAGSAIGVGNIWKFPYVVGQAGGGLFVISYLICVFLIGLPILISELYIGRRGQANVVGSMSRLTPGQPLWLTPALLGLFASFLILTFYSVIGGWILDFEFRALLDEFRIQDPLLLRDAIDTLLENPARQLISYTVFIGATMLITMSGVNSGVERANKILMPCLFIILIGLLLQSFFLSGFSQAIDFLFHVDLAQIDSKTILEAMGQSFFSLSIGLGIMVTYGSYLSKNDNIPRMALTVAILDTTIALLAGIVIFSTVFTFELEPNEGPRLIFTTLPLLFSKMIGGYYIGVFFFLLIGFAALSSAISLFETIQTWLQERYSVTRTKSSILCGIAVYVVGLLSVFSTNILSNFKILGLTIFDFLDKLTSNFMLPISGLLFVLFFGWKLGHRASSDVLSQSSKQFQKIFLFATRFIAPIGVIIVMIYILFPNFLTLQNPAR